MLFQTTTCLRGSNCSPRSRMVDVHRHSVRNTNSNFCWALNMTDIISTIIIKTILHPHDSDKWRSLFYPALCSNNHSLFKELWPNCYPAHGFRRRRYRFILGVPSSDRLTFQAICGSWYETKTKSHLRGHQVTRTQLFSRLILFNCVGTLQDYANNVALCFCYIPQRLVWHLFDPIYSRQQTLTANTTCCLYWLHDCRCRSMHQWVCVCSFVCAMNKRWKHPLPPGVSVRESHFWYPK